MSLSSRGCAANIERVIETKENKLIVEITCFTQYVKNGVKKRSYDYTGRVVLMNPNNEVLNHGDFIKIESFYIKNRNHKMRHQFDTIVITNWILWKRNIFNKKYNKQLSDPEILEVKRRQRQAIEQEIEAEEQDLDEYIDSIDENSLPF